MNTLGDVNDNKKSLRRDKIISFLKAMGVTLLAMLLCGFAEGGAIY